MIIGERVETVKREIEKLAIVRLGAMGDIVHSMAALQFVRRAFPGLKISWFVEEKFAGVLEGNEDVDEIITVDLHSLKREFSFSALARTVSKISGAGDFDLVVDMQGLIKSAIVARLAGANVAGGDFSSAREGVASILYSHRYRIDCTLTAPYRFASLLGQALGVEITMAQLERKSPYLGWSAENIESSVAEVLDGARREKIVIFVGASNESKRYPPGRFAELCDMLGERYDIFLLAGSEAEREDGGVIEGRGGARLLPPLNLDTLKFVLSSADLVIGGDTGPVHMAWALNRPSIVLFGSTPVEMMMQGERNIAISSGAKIANPCGGFDRSDRSIASIEPEKIAQEAERLLS
jgi:heptosyltransferase-1